MTAADCPTQQKKKHTNMAEVVVVGASLAAAGLSLLSSS